MIAAHVTATGATNEAHIENIQRCSFCYTNLAAAQTLFIFK
jgi:hypothetical protein